jgi:hypothetical protein
MESYIPKDIKSKVSDLFKDPPALLKEPYVFYTLVSIPFCIVVGTLIYRLFCKKKDTA